MTPEQQAAEVLAAHGQFWERCRCGHKLTGPTHDAGNELRAHVAAALAAAGVLRDPDAHEAAVDWSPTLRNDGTHEYTVTGDCHGEWEQALRRRPATSAKPTRWEKCATVPDAACYPHETAAIDGAAHTTGHGRDEVTGS